MKKFLNILGIIGSVILTVILTFLIFAYVLVLNVKIAVSKNGISNMLKNIDVVETLKSIDEGDAWEDFKELSNEIGLTEEQFEEILNSENIKDEIGNFINKIIDSVTSSSKITITKAELDNFINIAINEYNKVSEEKISENDKLEILNSLSPEIIEEINEELRDISFTENDENDYVEIVNKTLFDNYSLIILLVIMLMILLIALFRFSYYKWIPYVVSSFMIVGLLTLLIAVGISYIPLNEIEFGGMITHLITVINTRIYITAGILLLLSVALCITNKFIKSKIANK